jgi:hypothetical protein
VYLCLLTYTTPITITWYDDNRYSTGTRFIFEIIHKESTKQCNNHLLISPFPFPTVSFPMSISEVKPANDQVVVVQDPSNAENVKDGNTLKPRERAVIERALKRTVRWQRNHKLAEEHCKNVPLPHRPVIPICNLTLITLG